MSTQLQDSGQELRQLREGIKHLGHGQETLTRRADDHDRALAKMQRDLQDLEREVQNIKSAPPTRSVSPAPSYRGGPARNGGGGTPRYAGGDAEVDELQIVVGGCRARSPNHVRTHSWFGSAQAYLRTIRALRVLQM